MSKIESIVTLMLQHMCLSVTMKVCSIFSFPLSILGSKDQIIMCRQLIIYSTIQYLKIGCKSIRQTPYIWRRLSVKNVDMKTIRPDQTNSSYYELKFLILWNSLHTIYIHCILPTTNNCFPNSLFDMKTLFIYINCK